LLKQSAAAVATSREGHRWRRSGRGGAPTMGSVLARI